MTGHAERIVCVREREREGERGRERERSERVEAYRHLTKSVLSFSNDVTVASHCGRDAAPTQLEHLR
jgi:hypothetical protein